tara:strand:- start:723 stop:914 length:192 start_codon:yes stop_codon:yes gene_type:complete
MLKLSLKKTFEIPEDDFDSWCRSHRIGRKHGRQLLRDNIEDAAAQALEFELQQTKKMELLYDR